MYYKLKFLNKIEKKVIEDNLTKELKELDIFLTTTDRNYRDLNDFLEYGLNADHYVLYRKEFKEFGGYSIHDKLVIIPNYSEQLFKSEYIMSGHEIFTSEEFDIFAKIDFIATDKSKNEVKFIQVKSIQIYNEIEIHRLFLELISNFNNYFWDKYVNDCNYIYYFVLHVFDYSTQKSYFCKNKIIV